METIKEKDFDCLKMKSEIQAKIYAEIKDMTTEERIAYFHISAEQDPFRQHHDTAPHLLDHYLLLFK
jgi:hypothetical protein